MDRVHRVRLGISENSVIITAQCIMEIVIFISQIHNAHSVCPVIGVNCVISIATTSVSMKHATSKRGNVLSVKQDIGVIPVAIDAASFVLGHAMYQLAGVHLVKLDFGEVAVIIHAVKDVLRNFVIKLMVLAHVKMDILEIHALTSVYPTVKHAVR